MQTLIESIVSRIQVTIYDIVTVLDWEGGEGGGGGGGGGGGLRETQETKW